MKVVATFHTPSSVLASTKCCLSEDPDLEFLVVAKLDRIEVYSLQLDGHKMECKVDIWGRVVTVKPLPIDGSPRSNLVVLTDHPDPMVFILTYDADAHTLSTAKCVSLHERAPATAEFLTDVFVDPAGTLAVVSVYKGKLKAIVFEDGKYDSDFDLSIPELNLVSLSFIHDASAIAILSVDQQGQTQLLARDIDIGDFELSPTPSLVLAPTSLSSNTFPPTDAAPFVVSVPSKGVLILGGRKILYYELATEKWQEKHRGKAKRAEKAKAGKDHAEAAKAREKEQKRKNRKRKPKATVEWPWAEVTAWCAVEGHGTRYLIGDAYGRLAMLSLDALDTRGLVLIPLGETSPATTLTYLTSQIVYVGSHWGDSQLIRIHPTPISLLESPTLPIDSDITTTNPSAFVPSSSKGKGKAVGDDDDEDMDADVDSAPLGGLIIAGKGSHVEVVETFKNIAPILDAVQADVDGAGHPELVTCSGGRNTGTLNGIKNAADFVEEAIVKDVEDITRIWPIRASYQSTVDTHVLVSTLRESYLLRLDDDHAITRVALPDTHSTIAFSNLMRVDRGNPPKYIDSERVVHVTPYAVHLLEPDFALGAYTKVGDGWSPKVVDSPGWKEREIVAAGITATQVVLALTGARLVILGLHNDKFVVSQWCDTGSIQMNATEISAISCTPFNPNDYFTTSIALSFWGCNIVEIFSLANKQGKLVSVAKSPPLPAVARSLLFYDFAHDRTSKKTVFRPYLLAGCADGSLVSFSWHGKELINQDTAALGATPLTLTATNVNGVDAVFACGSRAAVFFWDKGLRHSPVSVKDAIAAAKLTRDPGLGDSLILATDKGLTIGRISDLEKMHIRSVGFGYDVPQRIKYCEDLKAFGVGFIRTEPVRIGEPERPNSSFSLVHGTSLTPMAKYGFEGGQILTALEVLPVEVDGRSTPCFFIGTAYPTGELETKEGRILMLGAVSNGSSPPSISLLHSTDAKGCVWALAIVNGMLAAAINSSVHLYKIATADGVKLQRVGCWDHNFIVRSLVSRGNVLILGDCISSVSVLNVVGTELRLIAKDYGPLWPVCVESFDDNSIIGANGDCNLFSFSAQVTDGRTHLMRDGSYYIADGVNKFMAGTLSSKDNVAEIAIEPRQIFFTAAGRIGIVADIDQTLSVNLSALQRNMASVIVGAGGVNHTSFRAPRSTNGQSEAASFGFLDGDFLEQFLAHEPSSATAESIIAGKKEIPLEMSYGQIQKVLETLQSMH
ncbi:hypothetical protein PLICRDRAFT_42399 [Plicaturopsis crispa FD-325 SS-3]|nr:hypothetical protein PLICRDRAFT_42399 [Plicaturopsis crispa FD-325 SS-3]